MIYRIQHLIYASLLCILMSACAKNNQSCINKLDGEWEETSTDISINGIPTNFNKPEVITYVFNPYKYKDSDMGTATIKKVLGTSSITENIEYQITKDCTEFWWSTTDSTDNDDIRATILQLTGSSFEFEYSEQIGQDVYNYQITLTKQ